MDSRQGFMRKITPYFSTGVNDLTAREKFMLKVQSEPGAMSLSWQEKMISFVSVERLALVSSLIKSGEK